MATLSDGVTLVWSIAAGEAAGTDAAEIEPGHLLIALAAAADMDGGAIARFLAAAPPDTVGRVAAELRELRTALTSAGADPVATRRSVRAELKRRGGPGHRDGDVMHRNGATRRIFDEAVNRAVAAGDANAVVTASDLLFAWAQRLDDATRTLLTFANVDDAILRRLLELAVGKTLPPAADVPEATPGALPTALDTYGRDLTALAAAGKLAPVIGRREEMRAVARVLAQARKGNPLLLGEPGVGKTCIVEGIAQRIVSASPPPALAGLRIVELSLNALVAGTQYRGQFEERMQNVLAELEAAPNTVAFIDEIHTLVGAGGSEGALDAANIVKPALARGGFRVIGATTVSEYRRHIERDPALERRFQPVWVEEPTRAEALEVLIGLRESLQSHHGLTIDDSALEAAVDLSVRYLRDLRLPDKAVDLVDQACAARRIQSLSVASDAPADDNVGRDDIAAVVAMRAKVPLEKITESESDRLLRLEDLLGARVKGQPEALATVAAALRQARAGLRDPKRPRGVFLFAGATGTGKTALAKAIAEVLYGDEDLVIRLDMSEYKERHFISRLVGAPPGYQGHEVEGQLTGPIRSRPSSVVLLDEVEKAHQEVLDLCLQIFDEGRLTDSRGRLASFTEAVVICTTNLGTAEAAEAVEDARPKNALGFRASNGGEPGPAPALAEAYAAGIVGGVRAALRPELVNRIDHIVVFRPLDQAVMGEILDKAVRGIEARLSTRQITLELTGAARDLIATSGYEPAYGARHVARAVDLLLTQPLADGLLKGTIPDGAHVIADVDATGAALALTAR